MKKLAMLLLIMLGLTASRPALAEEFDVDAQNAFAVEVSTGKILYEKRATKPVPIGPTSKLLTAYVIYHEIEAGRLQWQDKVTISDYPYDFTTVAVSNVPLEAREYTVKQLFEAMLVTSANAATMALAEHVAGSEAKFVDMMKDQAKALGITDAKLVNATGLSNQYYDSDHRYPGSNEDDENVMSAKSLGILAYRLVTDYPEVLKITEKPEADFDGTTIYTYNMMLPKQPYFRGGVNGLATGTTDLAGAGFVASATTGGIDVITVVLNADGWQKNSGARFEATNQLLNHIAGTYSPVTILKKNKPLDKTTATVQDGQKDKTAPYSKQAFTVIRVRGDQTPADISYEPNAETFVAPITKGDNLGRFVYKDPHAIGEGYLGDLPSVPVQAKEDIKRSFFLKVLWNHFVTYVNDKL